MTTQSTGYPETTLPTARRDGKDDRTLADTLHDSAVEPKAKLRQMMDSGRARVSEWKGGVEGGIRERPIQSILIAAAVGAVIGVIVGRRSR